jgi:C4-dicarboxylate-specific signal transduction histidine kinase
VEFWIPNRRLETITQSDLLDETKVIKKTTLSKYFAPWSLIITAATFIPDEEQKAADISESLILEYVAILVVLLVVSAAIVWQSGRNETRRIAAEENLRSLNEELELRIAERSAELEKTHAQLIQSEKMATLGEMATGVAHELNQPLNVIRMAASNIRRKTKQGESDLEHLNGKLDKIDSQVDRATAIIDHMRIFGRKTFAMHWLTPNGQTKPSQNFWQA